MSDAETTTPTPAYLAEFTHRVPVGARIPAGEEYVVYNPWFHTFSLRTSSSEVVQLVANPCYTRKPIAAPLPTKPGSLVIAHTADDLTRRPFMLDTDGTWFGPLYEGRSRWYSSKEFIDPAPAKAVEARP